MEYLIRHYGLEQGALEIEYIEEFFGEFARRKTAAEITARLADREHLIVMAVAALPDDPGSLVPVGFKVCHELFKSRVGPAPGRPRGAARGRRRIRQSTRALQLDWRHAHRLAWTGSVPGAHRRTGSLGRGERFDEVIVKTKNRHYEMRGTLANLHFNVVKFAENPISEKPRVEGVPEQAARARTCWTCIAAPAPGSRTTSAGQPGRRR